MSAFLVSDKLRSVMLPNVAALLVEHNMIHLDEVDDDDGEVTDEIYHVNDEIAQGHENITPEALLHILNLKAGPLSKTSIFGNGPRLTDAEALDALNYLLSAPEWSVSFLEDICSIVRQTGRTEVKGAQWDRH